MELSTTNYFCAAIFFSYTQWAMANKLSFPCVHLFVRHNENTCVGVSF